MNEQLEIVITNDDVRTLGEDDRLADRLAGLKRETLLGNDDSDLIDSFMNLMPKIIARKIERLLKDYEITEIALSFKVTGTVGIIGVNGDVQVKIKPKSR